MEKEDTPGETFNIEDIFGCSRRKREPLNVYSG
jgi:hypothetical protein